MRMRRSRSCLQRQLWRVKFIRERVTAFEKERLAVRAPYGALVSVCHSAAHVLGLDVL